MFGLSCQFGFQDWDFLKYTIGGCILPSNMDPLNRPELTPQQYVDYLDPFNCECRAYGRLKQENSENLVVRTHGYILLTREQERDVTEALGAEYVDWENHPDDLHCDGVFPRCEEHRHERLRAIVKDCVPLEDSEPWAPSQIPQMYVDLEKLHELGILIRDIHQGNYLNGKLVDFSRAWTMPHPCLDRVTPSSIQHSRLDEAESIENMINQWAFNEDQEIEEFIPSALIEWRVRIDNTEGARENGGYANGVFLGRRIEEAGVDPRLYDWRKWDEEEEEKRGNDTMRRPDSEHSTQQ